MIYRRIGSVAPDHRKQVFPKPTLLKTICEKRHAKIDTGTTKTEQGGQNCVVCLCRESPDSKNSKRTQNPQSSVEHSFAITFSFAFKETSIPGEFDDRHSFQVPIEIKAPVHRIHCASLNLYCFCCVSVETECPREVDWTTGLSSDM